MSERSPFPDLPPIDPWWDLYMPATFGEIDAVLDALESVDLSLPLAARGDCYAVGARAFAVLGRPVESDRLAEQAFRIGGTEAEALATFVCPDGIQRAERRLAGGGRAGLRADAACDLAARLCQAGEMAAASDAVDRGLATCPSHGEARRWARFFAEADDVGALVKAALDPRRARWPDGAAARDAIELLPVRRSGWLSVERYNRRVLGTPPPEAWAPAGSALGRLQDAGVGTCFFALDREYATLPAAHPLVAQELAADALRAGVSEERDVTAAATTFWAGVAGIDGEAIEDAAQLLVSLGTADARLAPLALEASACLLDTQPEHVTLWEGYRSWLGHLAGQPDACARARAVVAVRPADPMAWRLAVEVLRAEGRADEVERAVRAARSEAVLAQVVRDVLGDPATGAFRAVVSGRIVPRWGRRRGGGRAAGAGR
jgi:hypothetical protein